MFKILTKLAELANERVKKHGAQYYTFSLFIILHFPISYYYEISSETLYTNFWLRFLPIILCTLLLFKNKWPKKLKKFIPLFWYICVSISIPFVGAYSLLKNNFSVEWLVNFNVGIIMIILLLDWLSFFITELIGISLGILIFSFTENQPITLPDHDFYSLFFYMLFYIVFCGVLFTRNKETHNDYMQKAKDNLNLSLQNLVEIQTEELQISNKQLEHALAAKTEFLNNMSHEIRTPLQGFTLISQGIVDRWYDYDDANKLTLAKQVASNAQRLGRLVGNLLDLSKFSAGKMLLDVEKFDLLELSI